MSELNDDLGAALRLEPEGEHTFVAQVPAGWEQGRGTFGGLVLALLERALERTEPEADRVLRSLSGEILAPVVAGPARLEVEVLRRGNGLTSAAARLRQEGELRAHASALFARTRLLDREHLYLAPPQPLPWAQVTVAPVEPPLGPPFARAFEFRPTGPLPFSGSGEALVEGWVRLHRRPAQLGTAELLAYIDAYWPVAFALEEAPRPMATVAFTYQRCLDPSTLAPEEPLFLRSRGQASHQGFATELRELWTGDGRLVALNPQTFAIIR